MAAYTKQLEDEIAELQANKGKEKRSNQQ